METEAPAPSLGTGGGLNTTAIGAVCGVLGLIVAVIGLLFGNDLYSKVCKCIEERRKRRSPGGTTDQGPGSIELGAIERAGVSDSLLNSNQASRSSTGIGATGSEGNVTEVDQRPNHQSEINRSSQGCGDEQVSEVECRVMAANQLPVPPAEQIFYDIYLVSSSKDTDHVRKMKEMCQRNGWTIKTPFCGRFGEPEMQRAEEAVKTCSHVVLIITKEDCAMKDGKYNMIIEMAFAAVDNGDIGGRVIPICCCDRKFLPLRLKCLTGSAIDDGDLEKGMIATIDRRIREQREAGVASGASNVGDRSDITDGDDEMAPPR